MKFSFLMMMLLTAVSCGKTNGSDNKSGGEPFREEYSCGKNLLCMAPEKLSPVVITSTERFPQKMAVKINDLIIYDECTNDVGLNQLTGARKEPKRFEAQIPIPSEAATINLEIFDRRDCTAYDDFYYEHLEEIIRSERNPDKILVRIRPDRNYRE